MDTLSDGQAALPLSSSSRNRVRTRVMHRIAEDPTSRHLTIFANEARWQPFMPDIEIKVLQENEGVMSYLLRLAPGAVLPAHRHPVHEECLVLSGTLEIGELLRLKQGDFHVGLKDVLHAPIGTVTGATIYLRGASPNPSQLV